MEKIVVPINRQEVVPSGKSDLKEKSVFRYKGMEIIGDDSMVKFLTMRSLIIVHVIKPILIVVIVLIFNHFLGTGEKASELIQGIVNSF